MRLHLKQKEQQFPFPQILLKEWEEIIKKDTIHFLHIERGSLYELETLLNIAVIVEILREKDFQPFINLVDEWLKILNG